VLAKAGLVKTLFDRFHRHLDAKAISRVGARSSTSTPPLQRAQAAQHAGGERGDKGGQGPDQEHPEK